MDRISQHISEKHEADWFVSEDRLWNRLVDRLVILFRFSAEEETRIRENKLLKMLSLLPEFAECDNPQGTGLLIATTYIAERKVGRDLFAHGPQNDEDILSRLAPFSRLMEGGDPEIIEKGLNLAALTMVKDYADDAEQDTGNGKYNPVASGRWNWRDIAATIMQRNAEIYQPQIDKIYGTEVALKSFWQY
jgi:hypothetical protein